MPSSLLISGRALSRDHVLQNILRQSNTFDGQTTCQTTCPILRFVKHGYSPTEIIAI